MEARVVEILQTGSKSDIGEEADSLQPVHAGPEGLCDQFRIYSVDG